VTLIHLTKGTITPRTCPTHKALCLYVVASASRADRSADDEKKGRTESPDRTVSTTPGCRILLRLGVLARLLGTRVAHATSRRNSRDERRHGDGVPNAINFAPNVSLFDEASVPSARSHS
jgi:hypothetical protein